MPPARCHKCKKKAACNTRASNQVLWPVYSHHARTHSAGSSNLDLRFYSHFVHLRQRDSVAPHRWETEISHRFKTLCGNTERALTHFPYVLMLIFPWRRGSPSGKCSTFRISCDSDTQRGGTQRSTKIQDGWQPKLLDIAGIKPDRASCLSQPLCWGGADYRQGAGGLGVGTEATTSSNTQKDIFWCTETTERC